MNELFLSKQDFADVLAILEAVRESATCPIAVGGSLAQRALLPDFARAIAEQPLSDVDLVLLGGSLANCPLQPRIKEDFYVTHINPSNGSYYFGLVHKHSRKWVDLFTPAYPADLKKITINEQGFEATAIETQLLRNARDLLWRASRKMLIKQKAIDKIILIHTQPTLDRNRLEHEFNDHYEYFKNVLPIYEQAKHFTVDHYIEFAISIAEPEAKPLGYQAAKVYPTDCIVTSNGIEIESEDVFATLF